jgi:hypothetical protein
MVPFNKDLGGILPSLGSNINGQFVSKWNWTGMGF